MFRSTSNFDRLLEKSTSQLLLEPDWDSILQLCDTIRQGDVVPKYAISAIKKKLFAPNPNVSLFALQVLESSVKNCGAPVHHEVATEFFMLELRSLIKSTSNENVKNKVLELLQTWSYAFRSETSYSAIQDAIVVMKMEGYKFPSVKCESEAMFTADSAPVWADGECCHRCRVQFSVLQRKHHCRHCGQIFCSKCSNHLSSIPKFGIEKEVRVCEDCFDRLQKIQKTESETELPAEYLKSPLSQQPQDSENRSGDKTSEPKVPPSSGKSEDELKEEEDLQLAIALSQSDAENKEKQKLKSTHQILSGGLSSTTKSNDFPVGDTSSNHASASTDISNGTHSELARYLNRSYWEQKQQNMAESSNQTVTSPVHQQNANNVSPTPSAPTSISSSALVQQPIKVNEKFQNGESDEMDEFLSTLRTNIEIFVNRMKSKSSRGRPIADDSSIQTLFMNITALHSRLLQYIQQQEDSRGYYEQLQDKLSQIKDAREALDALREDHEEKLRRQAEEAERQRQIMMAHKLEIMRKKKQEYLQYQRQLALQRMQEQERDMARRQEQQQIYQQQGPPTGMQMIGPPSGGNSYMPPPPPPPQGFTSVPPSDTSPVHGTYYQNPLPPPSGAAPKQIQQFPVNNEYPPYAMQGVGMTNQNQPNFVGQQAPPPPDAVNNPGVQPSQGQQHQQPPPPQTINAPNPLPENSQPLISFD